MMLIAHRSIIRSKVSFSSFRSIFTLFYTFSIFILDFILFASLISFLFVAHCKKKMIKKATEALTEPGSREDRNWVMEPIRSRDPGAVFFCMLKSDLMVVFVFTCEI